MSCPTCDHTMAKVDDDLWHCDRCGTIISNLSINGIVPKLVERCRVFEGPLFDRLSPVTLEENWRRLGIAESINKPEGRPT